jgi:hypothetical protein
MWVRTTTTKHPEPRSCRKEYAVFPLKEQDYRTTKQHARWHYNSATSPLTNVGFIAFCHHKNHSKAGFSALEKLKTTMPASMVCFIPRPSAVRRSLVWRISAKSYAAMRRPIIAVPIPTRSAYTGKLTATICAPNEVMNPTKPRKGRAHGSACFNTHD